MLDPLSPRLGQGIHTPASATPHVECAIILLQFGWDLLSALCCTAQLKVVHKDIKHSHMLYHAGLHRWKLIDFEHGGRAEDQVSLQYTFYFFTVAAFGLIHHDA